MWKTFCVVSILFLTLCVQSVHAYTKEEVVRRGRLLCGVSSGSPGFSSVDAQGRWSGLDVDVCRAVAVAVLGNAGKVEYLPLPEEEAFTALISGTVDILSRHSAWTFSRDSGLPVHFAAVSYYDDQALMVAAKLAARTAAELKKARVCAPVGSPYEAPLLEYLERRRVEVKLVPFETVALAAKGFENEACDVLSQPRSQLQGLRLGLAAADSAVILEEAIAKEPFAPVVRQGDDVWLNIVRWSLYAMIAGEEQGVTSRNAEELRVSNVLAVRRLLGQEGGLGKGLGLSDDWAYQILKQIGNYGEVFDRNLGQASPLRLSRGVNALWNKGGLLYAPPFR